MQDLLYKIALTMIPGVGPVTARNLVSYCGHLEAVFQAPKRALLKIPGVGSQTVRNIIDGQFFRRAEKELKFIVQNDIRPVFYLDHDYPERLKHLPDSPVLMFLKGNADLNCSRSVGIVGTRRPGIHGITLCEELVEELKPYGVTIVSGLAYGIDITAHRRCVESGIPTIGVLGHGLSQVYPPQHRGVAEKMIVNGGLLTEYPSDSGPDREHFPMRNRIIAGLCDALVVVETALKGGSMITAHMANDYNKDVFAFPGRVRDEKSRGCNHLIKTHRALLLESARDVAYIMRWEENHAPRPVQKLLFTDLTKEEKIIVDLLNQSEPLSIDKLTFESNITNSRMASLLLELEFKGIVKSLPGKRYLLI